MIKAEKKIVTKEAKKDLERVCYFSNSGLASVLLFFAALLFAIVCTQPLWSTISEGNEEVTRFTLSYWIPFALSPFCILDFAADYAPLSWKRSKVYSYLSLLSPLIEFVITLCAAYFVVAALSMGEGIIFLARFLALASILLLSLIPLFIRLSKILPYKVLGNVRERAIFTAAFSLFSLFLFSSSASVDCAIQGPLGLEAIFSLIGSLISLVSFFVSLYFAFSKKGEEKAAKALLILVGILLGYSFISLLLGVARFDFSSGSSGFHILFWSIASGFGGILVGSCAFFYLGIDVLYSLDSLKEEETDKEDDFYEFIENL